MRIVNVWIVISTAALNEYKEYRNAVDNDTEYTGPMTERIFRNLSRVADRDLDRLFSRPTLGGKVYNLFSLYFDLDREPASKIQEFFDELAAEWPNNFIIAGAWWWDGRQVGTQWDSETGEPVGTPTYAIPTQAYRMMPDTVVYNEEGQEVSRTPASSNADLRDINLQAGQSPRLFS